MILYDKNQVSGQIQNLLLNTQNIEICILFGSAAKNKLNENSDIDIAVALKDSSFDAMNSIKELLENSLKRDIDFIDLKNAHGLILKEIVGNGILLINRNMILFRNIVKRMWYEGEDYLPLVRDAQKAQIKRMIL